MSWGFERGRIYNRKRDIHGRYSGQPRPGIITPADHAVIFIVSGAGGLKHGYADKFHDDGRVEYYGMGRSGDMRMLSGNRAIANHSADGKSLLLFREAGKRQLQFVDEMICSGYRTVRGTDRDGEERDAFVFDLLPLSAATETLEDEDPKLADDLTDMRQRALAASKARPETRKAVSTVIERSRAVRDYVVARAAGRCEGCNEPAPFLRKNGVPYLEPHHIKRLSDGGPDDIRLVIALCPSCHRRVHCGADGAEYNSNLLVRMAVIESQ